MRTVVLVMLLFLEPVASRAAGFNLMLAPGTLTENSVVLLWDKQYGKGDIVYEILLNGQPAGTTSKTNFQITGLLPSTVYAVSVSIKAEKRGSRKVKEPLKFKTPARGAIYNVLDYGANGDGKTINTKAIQKTIDACMEGGTVYIPKGRFVSGALFLKSNMTFFIDSGAVLKGSADTAGYLPLILNRFEGWELETYASLLNAGKLNRDGSYIVTNLRITGGGTIEGGGKKLGNDMISARGIRSRGRLVMLMNCREVSISHLTLTEPPCWNLHYIYSDQISCHDLNIITYGIRNGDGIDPDSSTDSYIFNCTFDTGDDCIAIKSGKNPEGYYIAKPTKNVRITNCDFKRGHGISIGSEMSGGVSDVLVQDCKAGALLNGVQIKGTKERGGYVKNVTVTDCQLLKITVFSALSYNNDGDPAPVLPVFSNFTFKNIDLSAASAKEPVININGFPYRNHKLRNVLFVNILLPENAQVVVKEAENVNFEMVRSVKGTKPEYIIHESSSIRY